MTAERNLLTAISWLMLGGAAAIWLAAVVDGSESARIALFLLVECGVLAALHLPLGPPRLRRVGASLVGILVIVTTLVIFFVDSTSMAPFLGIILLGTGAQWYYARQIPLESKTEPPPAPVLPAPTLASPKGPTWSSVFTPRKICPSCGNLRRALANPVCANCGFEDRPTLGHARDAREAGSA